MDPAETVVPPNNIVPPPVDTSPAIQSKNSIVIASIIAVLVVAGGAYYFLSNSFLKKSTQNTAEASITPAKVNEILQFETPEATPNVTTTLPTNSPNPTNTATPPTPTPRQSNPPKMSITYPTEGQNIEMNSQQTFCLVDVPNGGDQSGLQKKQNINNGGWSGYTAPYTSCYSPAEGNNTISLQYKNSYEEESPVYTVNFTFHRTQ